MHRDVKPSNILVRDDDRRPDRRLRDRPHRRPGAADPQRPGDRHPAVLRARARPRRGALAGLGRLGARGVPLRRRRGRAAVPRAGQRHRAAQHDRLPADHRAPRPRGSARRADRARMLDPDPATRWSMAEVATALHQMRRRAGADRGRRRAEDRAARRGLRRHAVGRGARGRPDTRAAPRSSRSRQPSDPPDGGDGAPAGRCRRPAGRARSPAAGGWPATPATTTSRHGSPSVAASTPPSTRVPSTSPQRAVRADAEPASLRRRSASGDAEPRTTRAQPSSTSDDRVRRRRRTDFVARLLLLPARGHRGQLGDARARATRTAIGRGHLRRVLGDHRRRVSVDGTELGRRRRW